ncbi:hypothetical protein BUALT_Bualt13G0070700 [Buddleja alternifolia]|uniref:DUF4216 domain-containing protein n=1 Tax=Buddleja alternifolia TaxID=168488 RepID=A0AAV6WJJ9_9LAMI|nr:hypothetical protein BUALT_Bualt13G0070700 [Buddleja alternifolia]
MGVLQNVIELDYFQGGKIVMFECDWVSPGRAQKQDDNGFTLVNFSRSRQHNDPFVLASQVQQVFYVEDSLEKGSHVVVRAKARDSFDMDPTLSFDGGLIMAPQTRPCSKRNISEVVGKPHQLSRSCSTRHGAAEKQPGICETSMGLNQHGASTVQPNVNTSEQDRAPIQDESTEVAPDL